MKCRIFGLLLCLSLISLQAIGQEKVNIEDLITIALDQNTEITQNGKNLELLEKRETQSYLELLPSATLNIDGIQNTGLSFDQTAGELRTETGKFLYSSGTLNWDISNLIFSNSRIKRAKNNKQQQQWNLEATKNRVVLEVIRLYLEILQNLNQKDILEKSFETQELNLERTSEMIRLGALPGQDFYTQKAELSRIKSLQVENKAMKTNLKQLLLALLNLPYDTTLDLEKDNTYFSALKDEKELGDRYQAALEGKNELKSLEALVDGSKYQFKQDKSAYFPRLSLYYTYGTSYSSFQESTFNQQFFDDNIIKTLGVRASIPLFNGASTRNNVFSSKVNYENAMLDLEQYKRDMYVQLSNTYNTYNARKEAKVFREEQLEANLKAFELEQERYFLGQGTTLDLALAQRNHIESSLILSQLEYQILYDRYQILYY
jgi:outer membrane protein TolC